MNNRSSNKKVIYILIVFSIIIILTVIVVIWYLIGSRQKEDQEIEQVSEEQEEEIPFQDPNEKIIENYGGIPESGELVSIDVENKTIEMKIGSQEAIKYSISEDFTCEKVIDLNDDGEEVIESCEISDIEVEGSFGADILLNIDDEIKQIKIYYYVY